MLFLILFLIFTSHFTPNTFAASGQFVSVTPAIARLDFQTDPPEYEIIYKNNSQQSIDLSFRAQDFKDLEDGWKVNFLNEADSKNYNFSLSSWIAFEKQSMTLKPQEESRLKVLIDRDKLSPGGHYASILAEIKTNQESKDPINLKNVLSSLLFVRTSTGSEKDDASAKELQIRDNLFNFPQNFALRFENNGNTDLVPHGLLSVYDPFNRQVAKAILNEGSLTTLPQSVRRYDIKTNKLSVIVWPGYYTASAVIKYGKKEKETSIKLKFFKIGNVVPVTISIIIFLAILFLFRKKLSRQSNRQKLAQFQDLQKVKSEKN